MKVEIIAMKTKIYLKKSKRLQKNWENPKQEPYQRVSGEIGFYKDLSTQLISHNKLYI